MNPLEAFPGGADEARAFVESARLFVLGGGPGTTMAKQMSAVFDLALAHLYVIRKIDKLLAESPAGDAGESGSRKQSFDPHGVAGKLRLIASGLTYNEGKAEGVAKHWIYEVAWRIQAGLDHVPDEKRMRGQIDDLRARLQAAEADLAAAKSIYREHWDDCDTVAEMMRSACNEAVLRLRQFKDRGGIIDKLEADLAAAQQQAREASQIAMTANTEAVRYKKERDAKLSLLAAQQTIEETWSILGHRDKALPQFAARQVVNDLAAAKAEGARAVVEAYESIRAWAMDRASEHAATDFGQGMKRPAAKCIDLCNSSIEVAKLRAAQPQPQPTPNIANATAVKQVSENEFLAQVGQPQPVDGIDKSLRDAFDNMKETLTGSYDVLAEVRSVADVVEVLYRRALEGKP